MEKGRIMDEFTQQVRDNIVNKLSDEDISKTINYITEQRDYWFKTCEWSTEFRFWDSLYRAWMAIAVDRGLC